MGMTGSGAGSGMMGGWAGGSRDRVRSAKGNIRVKDGSGLVQGTAKGGKAAKDDEGSENFRGRS